jgi:hypothetical protein
MSLRASSSEHEAKNRYREYAQRFFGVYRHLIMFSPSSEHEAKKPLQSKYQIRTTVFWCSVLAAPDSRAAVSLS